MTKKKNPTDKKKCGPRGSFYDPEIHPKIAEMGAKLGLTEETIYDLFRGYDLLSISRYSKFSIIHSHQ